MEAASYALACVCDEQEPELSAASRAPVMQRTAAAGRSRGHGGARQAEVLRASGSTAHKCERCAFVRGQSCVRCAGAGSVGTGGERWCTGRERATAAENASTVMTVTSDVSLTVMLLMSSDVKSVELGIGNMGGAAPGISL